MRTKKEDRFISLDIGRGAVKFLVGSFSSQGIRINKFFYQEYKNQDITKIIQQIKEIASSEIKKIFLINSSIPILTRQLLLSPLPEEELLNAIIWQLKDKVFINLEEAIISYQKWAERIDSDGIKKNRILVAIADRKKIEEACSFFKEQGYQLSRILNTSLSLGALFKRINKFKDQLFLNLHIGTEKTLINFFRGGILLFSREVTVASKSFTHSLTGITIAYPKKIELKSEEAERIKRDYGIPDPSLGGVTKEGIPFSQILVMMRPVLERLLNEIRRSLDYFYQESKEEKISFILLSGGGARLKGLDNFLQQNLGIKIESWQIPPFLLLEESLNKKEFEDSLNVFAPSIGIILGEKEDINLLPSKLQIEEVSPWQYRGFRITVVILMILALVPLPFLNSKLNNLKKQMNTLLTYSTGIGKAQEIREKLFSRQKAINQILGKRIDLAGVLSSLSRLIPESIRLEELELLKKEALRLKGIVSSDIKTPELVLSEFLSALENLEYFSKVELIFSKKIESQEKVLEFELISRF